MTTKTWNNGTADWYTDPDWTGGLPGPGDEAAIPVGTVSLSAGDPGVTVDSIEISGSGVLVIRDPGQTQTVTGEVSNAGTLAVDSGLFGGGGSSLAIGNTLSNSGTVNIGDINAGAATTVTATGLVNTGTINLRGSTTK